MADKFPVIFVRVGDKMRYYYVRDETLKPSPEIVIEILSEDCYVVKETTGGEYLVKIERAEHAEESSNQENNQE